MSPTAPHATTDTSTPTEPPPATLVRMDDPAPVAYLPHPLDPTPQETQARKDRRRLTAVTYSATRTGTHRARYFNAAGFDAYGHTVSGAYQEDQAIMTTPSPFTAPITQETTMDTPATAVITVYSKPGCVQCNATYRGLTKKGLEYRVVDVSADEEALAHVLSLGYTQVPVVENPHAVEGVPAHWYGYHPDYIDAMAAALVEVAA